MPYAVMFSSMVMLTDLPCIESKWSLLHPCVVPASKQMKVSQLVGGLQVSMALQPQLEEAMRIVPRSAFLPPHQAAEAWLSKAVMAAGGPPIVLGPPAAEMLALQVWVHAGCLLHALATPCWFAAS